MQGEQVTTNIETFFSMKTPGSSKCAKAALLALLLPAPLALAQTLNFTFTDNSSNVLAFGSLDVSGNVVTSGSATVNGIDGFVPGTFNLVSPSPVRALDGTDIIFNNLITPSQNPTLDSGGLGFAEGYLSAGHYNYVLNLWGNSPDNYTLFEAGELTGGPTPTGYVYKGVNGTMNLASIPEPATYAAVLGFATLGVAAVRRRKLARAQA